MGKSGPGILPIPELGSGKADSAGKSLAVKRASRHASLYRHNPPLSHSETKIQIISQTILGVTLFYTSFNCWQILLQLFAIRYNEIGRKKTGLLALGFDCLIAGNSGQ